MDVVISAIRSNLFLFTFKACSLCNVCVSGGVLHTEITFFWGATIRFFSNNNN